jgi:subtilisin family serine protease
MNPREHPRAALCALVLCLSASAALLAPRTAARRVPPLKSGAAQARADYVPGELLVRFRAGSHALRAVPEGGALATPSGRSLVLPVEGEGGAFDVSVESFGGSGIVPGLRLGRVEPERTLEAVAALARRADVLYAEPNYIRRPELTPDDPQFTHPSLYGLSKINAPQAWDTTQGSASVVVGVIDEGIDTQHEDLKDNLWTNAGEVAGNNVDDDGDGYVDDVNGYNFVENSGQVFVSAADDDHGTHVAGTIGARGNNGVGVVGINWQVGLMSIRVCNAKGCPDSAALAGYQYALRMKTQKGVNLRVLNNSYGGPGFSRAGFDAIQSLSGAGILFVAAAGNEARDDFSVPHYPSGYDLPNVIGVASTDGNDNVSGFSNFGARVVQIGAPGSSILSTTPRNYAGQNTGINGANGSTYSVFSGTSMAAPHVSGAAALVCAARPGISMSELRGVLAYSGDPVGALSDRTTTGRRLNVARSIASALENDSTPPATPTLQLVSQSGRGVTVSWTEPGDDGFTGQPADHDFVYTDSATGARTFLPTSFFQAQPGTTQTATLTLPYLSFGGTLEMRVYDNAGNSSGASASVSVGDNILSNPYDVTEGPAGALSTGGTRLAIDGDDKYQRNITLPFAFPYFGQSQTQVAVSSNGTVYFTPPSPPTRDNGDADDAPGETSALRAQKMLAVMWDDLLIDTSRRADAGVFQVTTPDSVVFRWQGTRFDAPTSPVNFEAELRRDGTVVYRYGDGNTSVFPVAGIASGEPEPYVVASHTSDQTRAGSSPISLTDAPSVTFTPAANVPTVQFASAAATVPEGAGHVTITVTRAGPDTTHPATAFYRTANGTASDRSDYTAAAGTLSFAANETSKSFDVLLTDDRYDEADEAFTVTLGGPARARLGTPSVFNVNVTDDDAATAASPVRWDSNFDADFFVRRHYADFLNREPDAEGLAFWKNQTTNCGNPNPEVCRVNVSAAFFLSIEFQETGFLVYRVYRTAYGDATGRMSFMTLQDFLPDTRRVGDGVVVGRGEWQQRLESNKTAFALEFVQRQSFTNVFLPGLTAAQFVAKLDENTGGVLTQAEADQLAAQFPGGASGPGNSPAARAAALLAVAQNATLRQRETNRAFVLMQFYGYLRRNPSDPPDVDFTGFNFWLGKLEEFGGDFVAAEMVKAFITSDEYVNRFGGRQ